MAKILCTKLGIRATPNGFVEINPIMKTWFFERHTYCVSIGLVCWTMLVDDSWLNWLW